MKFIFLICLLITTHVGAAAPKFYTMITSTQIDLDKLFYSYDPVSYMDYGFPQQLAHTYSVKTTYQIPVGLTASSTTKVTAPYRSCPWGQCTNYSGYKTETVILKHPDLKVTWEIINEETKKIVSTQTGALILEFGMSGDVSQAIQLAGYSKKSQVTIFGQTSAQGIQLEIPNSYSADKVVVSYAREFATQRLSEMRFDLKSKGTLYDYELSGVQFTKEATKTIYKTQGAMLNFNRDIIGFYFGIAGSISKTPTLSETTISHD